MSGAHATEPSHAHELRGYLTGYALAVALTAAAFALVEWRVPDAGTTLALVFGLGLVQMVVHFRWFLHIRLGTSTRQDLQLILFSTLIIALMVGGTLVILFNLRGRMM